MDRLLPWLSPSSTSPRRVELRTTARGSRGRVAWRGEDRAAGDDGEATECAHLAALLDSLVFRFGAMGNGPAVGSLDVAPEPAHWLLLGLAAAWERVRLAR
jgi:hypothetical protein